MKRATKDKLAWISIGVIVGSAATVLAALVRLAFFTSIPIL